MTLGHINYRVARPTRGRELRAGRPAPWALGAGLLSVVAAASGPRTSSLIYCNHR